MNLCTVILFATATMMAEGKKADIVVVFDNPYEAKFGNYSFGINETLGYKNYRSVINQGFSAIQSQKNGPNDILFGFYKPYGCYDWYGPLGKSLSAFSPQTQSDILAANETIYYWNIEDTLRNYNQGGARAIDRITLMMQNAISGIFGEKINRVDAPDSMVVLVFKDRNDKPSTIQAVAERLGIKVYAIGIGNVANSYLEEVSGSADRVIKIDNLDLLENTLDNLFTNITTTVRNVTALPVSPVFKCDDSIDAIFVFDSFSSRLNHLYTVNGMTDLIYGMTWGPNNINVGYVAFCGVNPVYQNLQGHLMTSFRSITKCWYNYNGSVVIENYANQTVIGMQKALDMFATTANRRNSPDIMVVVTDKVPPSIPMLEEMIARSAASHVKVYTIGVGKTAYDSLVNVNGTQRTFYCNNHETFEYSFPGLCD